MTLKSKTENRKYIRIYVHPALHKEITEYQKRMKKLKGNGFSRVDASKRIAELLKTIRNKNI